MTALTRSTGRRRLVRWAGAALAAALTLSLVGSAEASRLATPDRDAATTAEALAPSAGCPDPKERLAGCLLTVAIDGQGRPMDRAAQAQADLHPYTAADLQDAYRLPSDLLGARQTIAIVGPHDNPNAAADLAVYREANDLPPCTSDFPCLRKVDQRGGSDLPPAHAGWGLNLNAGLQMASAACPNCQLLLVEADSPGVDDIGAAVDQAVAQGAVVVVVVAGTLEYDGQMVDAVHYDHPGVVITAPSGSSGFGSGNSGRQLVPAAYGSVIAVGGTTLYPDDNPRGWTEAAWRNGGSGCSVYVPRPSWQSREACGAKRTVGDTAAVADLNTPVALYDSYGYSGWLAVGGTTISAALVGGVRAGREHRLDRAGPPPVPPSSGAVRRHPRVERQLR